jgi:transmembrane sensor
MTRSTIPGPDPLEAAAVWHGRIEQASSAEVPPPELERWLAEDPSRGSAFNSVRQALAVIDASAEEPELQRMRREALEAARHGWLSGRLRWHRSWQVAASLVFIAVLAIAVYGYAGRTITQIYATGPAESRDVALADGSVMTLDTSSTVQVRLSRSARNLDLLSGQAQFVVAHDSRRPFTVTAQGREIVATGTVFNVDVLEDRLTVTLIDGHVLIRPSSTLGDLVVRHARESHSLNAGQQLICGGRDTADRILQIDAADVSDWKRHSIILRGETLGYAVARINRYASRHLIVADDDIRPFQVSGVFRAGDVDGFLEALTSYLPVKTSTDAQGNVILRKDSAASSPH